MNETPTVTFVTFIASSCFREIGDRNAPKYAAVGTNMHNKLLLYSNISIFFNELTYQLKVTHHLKFN